jgi:class 3 adenylate cyclase
VAGYRRLFPGDELDRVIDLKAVLTELIEPMTREYGGRIFKEAGDLALSEFGNVVAAARCAAALRDAVVEKNKTLSPERHQLVKREFLIWLWRLESTGTRRGYIRCAHRILAAPSSVGRWSCYY